jgi:hypothetical protein
MWTPLTRLLIAATAISISLAGSALYVFNKGVQSGMATTQALWDKESLATQTDRAIQEASHRKTEQEMNDATEVHAQEIAAVREARAADRVAGAVVAHRLRDAARATAELAGQVRADSTAAGVREAAADAADLLADLRERADEAAGILADAADNAHFAGAACERRYTEARDKLKEH